MKWILVAALMGATAAQALPVRIEMGEAVFVPQAEVVFESPPNVVSTPPYTLIMQAPDIAEFADFTAAHTGETLRVFVCETSVFSSDFVRTVKNGRIAINSAFINGRLDAFVRSGCP